MKMMKEKHLDTQLFLTVEDGGHGFDADTELKEDWVQVGSKFIQGIWP
jgi:hypothetical protein